MGLIIDADPPCNPVGRKRRALSIPRAHEVAPGGIADELQVNSPAADIPLIRTVRSA
jgi:hypothetical protein